ncbi:MAG TPA: aldehyde ferredoxin oxidoreductase family protein [Aggregatilineaceae bacterium]|nr:aldehyde ferredoxin oxidoreductase family protein [Aggregatilineaceae bacterium]
MNGWLGKTLIVDLTTGSITHEPLNMELARQFIGGRGLGARLLWDLVGPDVEPLSPDNVIIIATGPMTATGFQTSNRFSVSMKSPLTGTVLDANSGGTWGMRFKRTGYDVMIIKGRASHPVYIEIKKGEAAIHDATHLWGMTVPEVSEHLGQDTNHRNVMCIGPAGEKLVRFAAIMNDLTRAAARGGPGAVMGSKNLKAVVVEGDIKVEFDNKEQFRFVQYEATKMLKANPITSQALPEFGTAVMMNLVNGIGALPTRNFQTSYFEQAEDISGEAITEQILVKNDACWACPIACTRVTKTSRREGEGPEYESAWSFGADCGISDLEAIAEANYLCNDLGLDTISAGSTIACAMELVEKGLIDSDLRFGRADLLCKTVGDIAYRRDLGDELAEGSARLAAKYGAPELSMSVKSLEMPAYDARGMQGQGLLFATSNRGGCHMRGNMLGLEVLGLPKLIDRFQVQGKASFVILHQNSASVADSLVACKFASNAVSDEYFARALSALTGVEYSTGDLIRTGERIWNMERIYNIREGFSREDDTLPPRLLTEPAAGGSAGEVSHLAPMLNEYYRGRGWDENGVPTVKKLKELGLEGMLQ